MKVKKLFEMPAEVTKENFSTVMEQAITLELATIPTYLSTYYSINRSPSEEGMLATIQGKLAKQPEALARELTLDVLVYANKTAALIMGVLIEEMLHLALSSNVKQAICKQSPNLMGIGPNLTFPTHLDGHDPIFPINLGPLSMDQLVTFLKIESPNSFADEPLKQGKKELDYQTIGQFYKKIEHIIETEYAGPYDLGDRLQLTASPKMAIYTPNSVNTMYYDRDHNPHSINADDSGGLIEVVDSLGAIAALNEIIEQGEGNGKPDADHLKFDDKGVPIPLPVVDGKVVFKPGSYDDASKEELSHFDKFMEAYSLGHHYTEKFAGYGLDFFSLFVYPQAQNPKLKDYGKAKDVTVLNEGKWNACDDPKEALVALATLGNAVFTYILLMIDACYKTTSKKEQFQIFMYGVHKSMIWLLSQFGRDLTGLSYKIGNKTYNAALTFEFYKFAPISKVNIKSPKEQILALGNDLATKWKTKEGWITEEMYDNYFPALPNIDLDGNVIGDMDKELGIPAGGVCPMS